MKILPIVDNNEIIGYIFHCPGCGENHSVNTKQESGRPIWSFNGSLEFPTFKPSLLIKSGCKITGFKPGSVCWCNFKEKYGDPAPFKCGICHIYVTDGKIQYLSDSTHELAGKIIEMEEVE